jgi:hypothetical protein
MSHYTVMVIGDNPEEQLAPFDENIEVDPYKNEDGEETTYNPRSKWDWYLLGGRFSGRLKLKPGRTGENGVAGAFDNATGIDRARKDAIDLDAMRSSFASDAAGWYDEFAKATEGLPWPTPWAEILAKHGEAAIKAAREEYHSQPMVIAYNKANIDMGGPEDYGQDRQAYIERMVVKRMAPHAILWNGEWTERGSMGWWGIVSNDTDDKRWYEQFMEIWEKVPDDAMISMYDCHI